MDDRVSELTEMAAAASRDVTAIERRLVQRVGARLLRDVVPPAEANLRDRGWGPRYRIDTTEFDGVSYKVLIREGALIATLPEVGDETTRLAVANSAGASLSNLSGADLFWEVERLAQQVLPQPSTEIRQRGLE